MTTLRAATALALAVVALGPTSPAAAQPEHAIPAENEALVARILGRDAPAVAGCTANGGAIQEDHAIATFRCGDDTVEVTLVEASAPEATVRGTHVAFFANPPAPELLAALRERADAEADPFIEVHAVAGAPRPRDRPRSDPRLHLAIVIGALGAFAIGWWVVRRRRA